MTEQAFKYRIIAQKRVYLCMDYGFESGDIVAVEVVRERNSGDEIPVMSQVRIIGCAIIEPIIARTDPIAEALERALAQPTSEEWAHEFEKLANPIDEWARVTVEELVGRG